MIVVPDLPRHPDWDYVEEVIALHYRWWTVKYGRDFVKMGPVSFTWGRWFGPTLIVQMVVLCRRVYTLKPWTKPKAGA